ncbi:hypothetical protein FQA39_LY18027 [Lamprigera yunnana]|nr:hypothetical protein FQA39_LY18027 [Lamprigera yunnana]
MLSTCKLKVSDLKIELNKRKLPVNGKKSDLVNRLKSALDSNFVVRNSNDRTIADNDKECEGRIIKRVKYIHSYQAKINTLQSKIKNLESEMRRIHIKFKKYQTDLKIIKEKEKKHVFSLEAKKLKENRNLESNSSSDIKNDKGNIYPPVIDLMKTTPTAMNKLERLQVKDVVKRSVVLLQGGQDIPIYNSDVTYLFKQESFFMWAFGVTESLCYGAIEVDTGISYMFVPHYPSEYTIWMGRQPSLDHFRKKYNIDYVCYTDEMCSILHNLEPSSLLLLCGVNTDSGLEMEPVHFDGIELFSLDTDTLYPEIAELRVIKTNYELDIINYITEVSSAGHKKIMKMVKPELTEYQCEAEFQNFIHSIGGCRHPAYTINCASGIKTAILHYGHAGTPNNGLLCNGDMCLFAMGASYFGYKTDIACSFPVSGNFTNDQQTIYEAVLRANVAVQREIRPGTSWACMHVLANRVLLSGLKDAGLLQGDISVMVTAGLGSIFQPHGLGHLIGLDVHDVGGYLPETPPRLKHPKGMEKLRTSRVLKKGMVLTIEPGCYFIDHLLDTAISDPLLHQFLVMEVIDRFRGFGGVRIGDVVIVTEIGVKNLVSVPRTVEEIEDWMAGNYNE